MNKGVLRSQLEHQSLVALAMSRIFNIEKITKHSKCDKRRNVFAAQDLLVSRLAGQEIDEFAKNPINCPFSTDNGCSLILNNLTVPSLCVKRILKENQSLSPIKGKILKAFRFINQTVKLVGVKK